jgi:hypothetical protein
VGALEHLRPLHLPQAVRPRGVFDVLAGEGLASKLDAQHIRTQPQRDLPTGQHFFGVDLSVFETGVAGRVEDAGEPGREAGALQVLRAVTDAREKAQDLRRALARVLSLAVRPVHLGVVLLHEAVVGGDELSPATGSAEVVIPRVAEKISLI